MLPPYGRHTVIRSTVCKKWFLKIVRSCGLWQLWSQMLRRHHGDRTIHEIKNRKVTTRRPYGDRMATVRHPHGYCSTSLPYGRRAGTAYLFIWNRTNGQSKISPSQCRTGYDLVCPASNFLTNIKIELSWMGAIWRPCSIQAVRANLLFARLCACRLFWHPALTKLQC